MLGAIATPAVAQSVPKIPAMVDPAKDLSAQRPGSDEGWFDSIYFTSQLKADGRDIAGYGDNGYSDHRGQNLAGGANPGWIVNGERSCRGLACAGHG